MIDIIIKRLRFFSNIIIITSGITLIIFSFYKLKLGYLGFINGAKGYEWVLFNDLVPAIIGLSCL